jgi:hypothetical protein
MTISIMLKVIKFGPKIAPTTAIKKPVPETFAQRLMSEKMNYRYYKPIG